MKNSIVIIVTLLVAFFCAGTAANATPENKEIVLTFKGWPPYLIREKDGRSGGFMFDVLQTVAAANGYEVAVKSYPEKRGAMMMNKGKVDVRAKAKEWVKNPEHYIWTNPVVESTDLLVFLKDNPTVFTRPEDLFGKRIGAGLGYGYPLLDSYFADKRITRSDTKSVSAMLMMLSKRRTDAAITNKLVALWVIRQNPKLQREKFEFSEKPVGKAGYRFMFTPEHNWKPFAELFNQELEKMRGDGRLEKIMKKYQ